jgi:hypothetical protein
MRIKRYPTQQLENGNTWTLVEVLNDDGVVVYSEDFITNYKPTGSRIVTDDQCRILMSDGSYVEPESLMQQSERRKATPVRETFDVDVDGLIDNLIDRWLATVRDDGESVAEKLEAGKLRGSRVDANAVTSLRKSPEAWVRSLRSSVVERAIPVDGRRAH